MSYQTSAIDAQAHSQHELQAKAARAFLQRHFASLAATLSAVSGSLGVDAAEQLQEALNSRVPGNVEKQLRLIRDMLASAGRATERQAGTPTRDLDAAIRWAGARVDELIDQNASG